MPIYEYKCRKCDEKFEIQRGIFEKAGEVKCTKCGDADTERVISGSCGGSCGGKEERWTPPVRFG